MTILEIKNLNIEIPNKKILNGINIKIKKNTFNTITGISGSGKTVLMSSLFKILPENTKINGELIFKGKSLQKIVPEIKPVFSNPGIIFNKNYKTGLQIKDMLLHEKIYDNKDDIQKKLEKYMYLFDLDKKILNEYPENITQKDITKLALILSISFNPELLVIDDSFKALDKITLNLLYLFFKDFKNKSTIIFLTSINSKLNELSDKIIYLYKGTILEKINYKDLKTLNYEHPYKKLLENKTKFNKNSDLTDNPKGCIYYDMCPRAQKECLEFNNKLIEYEKNHFLSCINLED